MDSFEPRYPMSVKEDHYSIWLEVARVSSIVTNSDGYETSHNCVMMEFRKCKNYEYDIISCCIESDIDNWVLYAECCTKQEYIHGIELFFNHVMLAKKGL